MSKTDAKELTRGERALAQAVYATDYEEMEDWKKDQYRRLLNDLPEHMRAGLDGNLLTKDQLAEGMEDVFERMQAEDDIPDEWIDGAAVFAKAIHKKFGVDKHQ